jgi:hypothetical protein
MLQHPQIKFPPFFGTQMGVPGSDTPEGLRLYPDALTFFVDGGHSEADDNNDGTDPRYPLATISQGITNATDGRGDLVLVSPGTYNPTAAITVDKADIRLIAVPIGGNPEQPENGTVVYPAASYDTGPMFIVEAPCTIQGFDIVTRNTGPHGGAIATAAASLVFDGDGGSYNGGFCHIKNCRFVDWWGAVSGIYFIGGAYNLIENCVFESFDSGIQFYSGTHNPTYNVIRRCWFVDNTNGIEMVVGSTPHNVVIQENIFMDYTDAIDFNQAGGGAGDGLVCGNWFETATDAATYDCTVAQAQAIGWNFSGNHYSE